MSEIDVARVSRVSIGTGLLVFVSVFLLYLFGFGYGAYFIAYIFYALMTLGILLALVNYFQRKWEDRREQVSKGIRFFVGLGLILLVFALVGVLLESDLGANFAANTSYVFLAIGVVLALVEYFQSEWGEGKKEHE
jgi:peptidoglycan/LPS O-acetylase OafA/YrhL